MARNKTRRHLSKAASQDTLGSAAKASAVVDKAPAFAAKSSLDNLPLAETEGAGETEAAALRISSKGRGEKGEQRRLQGLPVKQEDLAKASVAIVYHDTAALSGNNGGRGGRGDQQMVHIQNVQEDKENVAPEEQAPQARQPREVFCHERTCGEALFAWHKQHAVSDTCAKPVQTVGSSFEPPSSGSRRTFTAPRSVEITVRMVSGSELATIQCMPDESVYEVKQRLALFCGASTGQQHLVFGQTVLRNHDTLADCGIVGVKATLQFVLNRPSGIARALESRRGEADVNLGLECTMAELCDSILQVEHRLSEKTRPQAVHLSRAMNLRRRSELVCWMMQAFDVLQFDDSILHGTVLTLDRYYAVRESPIADDALQRCLLAAICTELKNANADEFPTLHWRRVVAHLCQGRVATTAILQTETEMLQKLGFVVGVPTPVSFLNGFMVRVRQGTRASDAALWESFAVFLLELALFDSPLAYGFPHVALAAGALSAACRGCGAAAETQEELLEDVAAYDPALCVGEVEELVLRCEERLLRLWAQCESGDNSDVGPFYGHVKAKFGRNTRQAVALMSPTEILSRLDVAILAKKESQLGLCGSSFPIGSEFDLAAGGA